MAAMLGRDLPLTAERHIIASFGWGGAKRIPFCYADVPNGFYVKPDGTELFIIGSLLPGEVVEPDDFNQALEPEEQLDFIFVLSRRVPPLVEADARGGWAALNDLSPDWQPVIGEIEDAGQGATGAASLDDFVEKLSRPRAAGPNTICQVLWCTRVVRNPSPSIAPVT